MAFKKSCPYYCKVHNEFVDQYHMDDCVCLPQNPKVSIIPETLQGLDSIWDLEPTKLADLVDYIENLENAIKTLLQAG